MTEKQDGAERARARPCTVAVDLGGSSAKVAYSSRPGRLVNQTVVPIEQLQLGGDVLSGVEPLALPIWSQHRRRGWQRAASAWRYPASLTKGKGVDNVDDAVVALPFALCAQLLGLHFSLALGRTPDNPFPAGQVNRVVQGVTIHPLSDD